MKKIGVTFAFDDELKKALAHRYGQKRLTVPEIQVVICGLVTTFLDEVVSEYRDAAKTKEGKS